MLCNADTHKKVYVTCYCHTFRHFDWQISTCLIEVVQKDGCQRKFVPCGFIVDGRWRRLVWFAWCMFLEQLACYCRESHGLCTIVSAMHLLNSWLGYFAKKGRFLFLTIGTATTVGRPLCSVSAIRINARRQVPWNWCTNAAPPMDLNWK